MSRIAGEVLELDGIKPSGMLWTRLPLRFLRPSWPLQLQHTTSVSGLASPQVRWTGTTWRVSSHGRVETSRGAVSYGSLKCSGYYRVKIGGQHYYVHRLVAAAFLGLPSSSDRWMVNHMDGDRSNNRVSNLEYVTPAENALHAWSIKPNRGQPILWRACGTQPWVHASSQSAAARSLGVSQHCILSCRRGLRANCPGNGASYEFRAASVVEVEAEQLDHEIWKLASYPGNDSRISGLMVSDHGRVRSTSRNGDVVSRGYLNANGYHVASKNKRNYMVHRLVAATFLGQPAQPDLQVNHKDGHKANNHLLNLEYVTASENVKHACALQARRQQARRKGMHVEASLKESDGQWLQFHSIKAAAEHTATTAWRISRVCHGHLAVDPTSLWNFRFLGRSSGEPDEEWRTVVFEGARV